MKINFNVDLEKLRQKQKQKAKTGMSMQSVVNNALSLPTQAPNGSIPNTAKNNGWGANAQ